MTNATPNMKPSTNQVRALERLTQNYPQLGSYDLTVDLKVTCGMTETGLTVDALLRLGWVEETPEMPGRHRITPEGVKVLEGHGPAAARKRADSILTAVLNRAADARWHVNRREERRRVASTCLDREGE